MPTSESATATRAGQDDERDRAGSDRRRVRRRVGAGDAREGGDRDQPTRMQRDEEDAAVTSRAKPNMGRGLRRSTWNDAPSMRAERERAQRDQARLGRRSPAGRALLVAGLRRRYRSGTGTGGGGRRAGRQRRGCLRPAPCRRAAATACCQSRRASLTRYVEERSQSCFHTRLLLCESSRDA